ncbi:hypothetical protein CCX46_24420 [Pseudomonas sp. RU47]|nr:hypothetical protein CCX46_24420 [Pseudomonas sp. RU47]
MRYFNFCLVRTALPKLISIFARAFRFQFHTTKHINWKLFCRSNNVPLFKSLFQNNHKMLQHGKIQSLIIMNNRIFLNWLGNNRYLFKYQITCNMNA